VLKLTEAERLAFPYKGYPLRRAGESPRTG